MFTLIVTHPRTFSAIVVAFAFALVGLWAYHDLKD